MQRLFGMVVATTAAALAPTMALAKDPVVQAVQVGFENVRYNKGIPTVDLEQRSGVVQIRPLPMDHGSFVFAVAVFNDSNVPANMDIGNIAVRVGSDPVGIMNVDRLIKKAENRSRWSQFGMALLGGLASSAAASERTTYHGTVSSPYATYHATYSAPSLSGQLRAARIEDQTVMRLSGMQAQLDATRDALSDHVIQMTTVDPGRMYAGKVVLEKIKSKQLPQQLTIMVNWNGEQYPFAFQIAEAGTPAPAFVQTARVVTPRPQRQVSAPASSAALSQGPRMAGRSHVDMENIVKRTAEVMPRC